MLDAVTFKYYAHIDYFYVREILRSALTKC